MNGSSDVPAVSIALLRRYLNASGWTGRALESGRADLFVLPGREGEQAIELYMPRDPAAPEGERLMRLALETLAALEDRNEGSVAQAVEGIGVDVLLARLPSAFRESIYIDAAEGVLRHGRRLLAHAAMAETSRERYASGISDVGLGYAERCRFGHTFRGSFGITIESPVGPHGDHLLDEGDHPPPVERLFMQRLARGFLTVRAAEERSDPGVIVRNYENGFNGNMCAELASLYDVSGADRIDFRFQFSPEWKPADDLATIGSVQIGARSLGVLKEAAQELKGAAGVPGAVIEGLIVALGASGNPADLENPTGSRDITIAWDGELGPVRVAVRLDPKTYLEAAAAHPAGRAVRLAGRLERLGRRWMLREPADFTVLP